MAKLLFRPIGVVTGLLAGLISKKIFQLLWGEIDEKEPPKPNRREAPLGKLALALIIEGALFRAVKGLVDHLSRQGFAKLTGSWPGEGSRQAAESSPESSR
jgi:hypothetical protein